MKYFVVGVLFSVFVNQLDGQILRPGEQQEKTEEEKKEKEKNQKKEKKEKEKNEPKTVVINGEEYEVVKKKEASEDTSNDETVFEIQDQIIYAHLIPSHVYRNFVPGNYPSYREDEVPGFKLSYMLGLRNKITKHFILDIGFAFYVNGENYFYEDDQIDSSVFITRNHHQLAVPIKLGYTFNVKGVDVFFSGGVAPSMLVNQVEKSEINVANQEPMIDRFVNKNNLNQFNMTLLGGVGVQYNFSENWGLQLMPEFRYNLFPSDINKSFEHRSWAVGFHVGLTFGK